MANKKGRYCFFCGIHLESSNSTDSLTSFNRISLFGQSTIISAVSNKSRFLLPNICVIYAVWLQALTRTSRMMLYNSDRIRFLILIGMPLIRTFTLGFDSIFYS